MRKAHRSKKAQIDQLANALLLNGDAIRSEKHKALTLHDLRSIRPKTENQVLAFHAFEQYDHLILNGSAGCGKSFLSVYHGLKSLLVDREQTHIMIIRSAVPTRDQGFLPGSLEEKSNPFEAPYEGICYELLGKATAYSHLKKAGQVSFETTGYLRGITLHNTFVIVDEAASMSLHEIDTIMTRLGDNSRIVFCGDTIQSDLRAGQTGYPKALRIWESMEEFAIITFNHGDICRNPVVKAWLIAMEEIK